MAIQIQMTTPLPNDRQVVIGTDVVLEISGDVDGYAPDFSTLSIQFNSIYAIRNGEFQIPSALFGTASSAVGPVPPIPTRFYDIPNNPFRVNDIVLAADSTSIVMAGTRTSSSSVISGLSTTTGLVVGMSVSGTGISSNTFISSINSSSQITLTQPVLNAGTSTLAFTNQITTRVVGVIGTQVELRDALNLVPVEDRSSGYAVSITATSRGFSGAISPPTITINPFADFDRNSIVFVTVEIFSLQPMIPVPPAAIIPAPGIPTRRVFVFRTTDTQPPQLVNFPSVVEHSNLAFSIVDVLGNYVSPESIKVYLNNELAIQDGYVQTAHFMGGVFFNNPSIADIFIRPKIRYANNQIVPVQIEVSDGYGNTASYNRQYVNHDIFPRVEFVAIDPPNDSELDPLNAPIAITLRTTEPLNRKFLNLYYEIDGVKNPETGSDLIPIVEQGQFVDCQGCIDFFGGSHTGVILVGSHETFISVNDLVSLTFNKKVKIHLVLQEVTELGDAPPGSTPFYQKTFDFVTISATLSPIIDSFVPAAESVAPADTQIRYRVTSRTEGSRIDLQSITTVLNGTIIAIDRGLFVNGYTGTIAIKQGSDGHTALVTINQPTGQMFDVGSTVQVSIFASDAAGNEGTANFAFAAANTNAPMVTVSPPGGAYKKLTRIKLTSDQPGLIYYTIDGSKPEIGKISTFSEQSPVTDVPVFLEGITQIKAFAVNANDVSGPITTEIYDLNPFIPEVVVLTPAENAVLERPVTAVNYKITLQRGFLVQVLVSVNGGVPFDVQNTLLESTVTVTGLRTGANTVEIIARDNSGNTGRFVRKISVQASQIIDFGITFSPLECPEFQPRPFGDEGILNDVVDTSTVVIIGLGRRVENLVDFGLGQGKDGLPKAFTLSNKPDGRHFTLRSFPVRSHTLYLYRKGRQIIVPPRDYVLNTFSGQLVLDHPIESGERLSIEYIAEPDINSPRMFTFSQLGQLYARHGLPSSENTLSLGAQMAFENGALRVLAVQGEIPEVDPDWTESFAAIEIEQGYWITPVLRNQDLLYYPSILANAFNHAEKMSRIENRKERIVAAWRLPGTPNGFDQSRIFLASIDQDPRILRVIDGESTEINGTFVAAAISGKGSGLSPIALPLTSKTVVGFTLQTTRRSPRLDLEELINQGFMPVQALAAGASIFRGRTCYTGITDPIREEASVQRTVDSISKELRILLENRFTGQLITGTLLRNMRFEVNTYLATRASIIAKGEILNVEVDPGDPRQVNLDIHLVPLYPFNQLSITIRVVASLM